MQDLQKKTKAQLIDEIMALQGQVETVKLQSAVLRAELSNKQDELSEMCLVTSCIKKHYRRLKVVVEEFKSKAPHIISMGSLEDEFGCLDDGVFYNSHGKMIRGSDLRRVMQNMLDFQPSDELFKEVVNG